MEKVAPNGGLMVVHGEDLVQFDYERFRAEGRTDGTNLRPTLSSPSCSRSGGQSRSPAR